MRQIIIMHEYIIVGFIYILIIYGLFNLIFDVTIFGLNTITLLVDYYKSLFGVVKGVEKKDCSICKVRSNIGTSKKYRDFLSEPIGDKNIEELPGIGPANSKKMALLGCDKVIFFLLHNNYYII